MFIIAIDGLPGAGKTTAIKELSRRFRLLKMSVKRNSIGDVSLSKEMIPKAKKYSFGCPERTFIFFSLRIDQLVAAKIESRSCDIVMMDRFLGSSFAYDINGNQIPKNFLEKGKKIIESQIDLILFFDVPFFVACARKKSATIQDIDFAQKLEMRYRQVAQEQNWVRIDATQAPEKVANDCFEIIMNGFNKKKGDSTPP